MKNVVIVGAGPAGLTAAYEILSKHKNEYLVTVLEETKDIGGISKTVNYNGNRMDMGGHRFFSKSKEVNDWWNQFLPIQGSKSYDDKVLNRDANVVDGGPNPEETDKVMLLRHRVSRILFSGKFFDYPISMKLDTIKNMGLFKTMQCGFSYIASAINKKEENNLENFYINRFGKELYQMFFEYYTENLWGRHPRDIDASWGSQRVKGLSITAVIKDMLSKVFVKKENREVETSLIEEFKYPKLGPGELWEIVAKEVEALGGKVLLNSKVEGFEKENGRISFVKYIANDANNKNANFNNKTTDTNTNININSNGNNENVETVIPCDYLFSSMPIKDLVLGMKDAPADISNIAKGLPYRDYMTVGVLVKKLKLKNETDIKTISNIVPDNWIYVQDRKVKLGRIQIFNNWSPYMVKDLENTIWIGLEYFVNEGDEFWTMSDKDFSKYAINEMIKIDLIDSESDVLDTHVERVKKAYPAYFDTFNQIGEVIDYLNKIPNLYCIGRNGQHRYNNLDHSMLTSFEAVKCMVEKKNDKSAIWNVNTEKEYHEKK